MHYIIYKITNTINNKIYIGAHKTLNKEDSYLGSGVLIMRAIKKYGRDFFKKEIITECSSEKEMWQKEADIVDQEFIARDDTYNVSLGGVGDIDFARKKIKWLRENDPVWREEFAEKNRARLHLYKMSIGGNGWKGRKHKEETKKKISESRKGKVDGKNNPSYGKHWITDGKISKLVPKSDPIPEGFLKGRV